MAWKSVSDRKYPHSVEEFDAEIYRIDQGIDNDVQAKGPDIVNIFKEPGMYELIVAYEDNEERNFRIPQPQLVDGGDYTNGEDYVPLEVVTVEDDGVWIVNDAHTAPDIAANGQQLFPEAPAGVKYPLSEDYDPYLDDSSFFPFEYTYGHDFTHYRLGDVGGATSGLYLYQDEDCPIGYGERWDVKDLNSGFGVEIRNDDPEYVIINIPTGKVPYVPPNGVFYWRCVYNEAPTGAVEYDVWGDLKDFDSNEPYLEIAHNEVDGISIIDQQIPDTYAWKSIEYQFGVEIFEPTGDFPDNTLGVHIFRDWFLTPWKSWESAYEGSAAEWMIENGATGFIVELEIDLPNLAPSETDLVLFALNGNPSIFSYYHSVDVDPSTKTINIWTNTTGPDTIIASQSYTGNRIRIALAMWLNGTDEFRLSVNGQAYSSFVDPGGAFAYLAIERFDIGGVYAYSSLISPSVLFRYFGLHLFDAGKDLTVLSTPLPLPTTVPNARMPAAAQDLLTMPLDGDFTLTSYQTSYGAVPAALNGVDAAFGGGAQPLYADSLDVTGTATTVDVTFPQPTDADPLIDIDFRRLTFQIDVYFYLDGGQAGDLLDFLGSNDARLEIFADDTMRWGDVNLPGGGRTRQVAFTPGQWNHLVISLTPLLSSGQNYRDNRLMMYLNGEGHFMTHYNTASNSDYIGATGICRFMAGLTGKLGAVRIIKGRSLDIWGGQFQSRTEVF